MAQFREMEAFAQLSSDLDPETKKQIDLGQRMTELLKQPQYAPMPVEDQVAVISAVSNGYLNKFSVKEIRQTKLISLILSHKSKKLLLDKIAKGEWDETIENELKKLVKNL